MGVAVGVGPEETVVAGGGELGVGVDPEESGVGGGWGW